MRVTELKPGTMYVVHVPRKNSKAYRVLLQNSKASLSDLSTIEVMPLNNGYDQNVVHPGRWVWHAWLGRWTGVRRGPFTYIGKARVPFVIYVFMAGEELFQMADTKTIKHRLRPIKPLV